MSTASPASHESIDISGVHPPIATPFDNDQNVDFERLASNLKLWNDIPFRGYVVLGSNGECAYLSRDERVDLVKHVRQLAPSNKLIIAGSGCESSRETIDLSNKMADAGADAVLVVTPCYYKASMTNDALFRHFSQVADASRVPVILYSVPGNTGIDLAPEVVIKLSLHPNIIGLKDSGGDITKIGNMVYKTKDNNFKIIAGSAGFLYSSLALGCVGGICALANVMGSEVCELYTLFHEGKHTEAQQLQHRLIGPNSAVTRRFGVPGLKKAMDWYGYYGGRTREPLLPLTVAETELLRKAFTDSEFKPPLHI